MAMQVKRPASNNAMSRAMGAIQVGLGVIGAVPSGGTSLLAVPGGLQAMRGSSGPATIESRSGRQVNTPNSRDPLDTLSGVANIASLGLDISKMGGGGAKKPTLDERGTPKQDTPKTAMQRSAEQNMSSMSDKDIINTLRESEIALNDLRARNPDLVKNLQMPIFKSIFEASKRYKSGQRINQAVSQ